MILTSLALALAPSAALLYWAYQRDTRKKESIRLLLLVFVFGILGVIPALALGGLFAAFGSLLDPAIHGAYEAFVVAALVEESVKYAILVGFARRHPEFDERADGLVYGMAASLGFAFLENALYVGGPVAVLIVRGLTAVPLHAGCGALIGYHVGLAHFDPRHSGAWGLLLAILVHGIYDLLVMLGGIATYAGFAVVVVMAFIVPRLFRTAVDLDERSGDAPLKSV